MVIRQKLVTEGRYALQNVDKKRTINRLSETSRGAVRVSIIQDTDDIHTYRHSIILNKPLKTTSPFVHYVVVCSDLRPNVTLRGMNRVFPVWPRVVTSYTHAHLLNLTLFYTSPTDPKHKHKYVPIHATFPTLVKGSLSK